LVLVLGMAILERFWWKHGQKPLEVKYWMQTFLYYILLNSLSRDYFMFDNKINSIKKHISHCFFYCNHKIDEKATCRLSSVVQNP